MTHCCFPQGMFDQGFMQQMMQNPMVQQMLNNPETMRNMLQMNPAVREVGSCSSLEALCCLWSRLRCIRQQARHLLRREWACTLLELYLWSSGRVPCVCSSRGFCRLCTVSRFTPACSAVCPADAYCAWLLLMLCGCSSWTATPRWRRCSTTQSCCGRACRSCPTL